MSDLDTNADLPVGPEPLYEAVTNIIEEARGKVQHAVNRAMVEAYWRIGQLIVDHQQHGDERAHYGTGLLRGLSHRLTAAFGRGFSEQSLRNMRQFYLTFRSAAGSELATAEEVDTAPSLQRTTVG
jgi:hypothetical protein